MEGKSQVEMLVKEIKDNLSQCNSSRKDEIRVMQAMLSDPTYSVQVYDKSGPTGEVYNPCQDFRSMCSSIISNAARISAAEAESMMSDYTVKKNEAATMVNVSKEFMSLYLDTGRKLPLGGREMSDISLRMKEVPETTRSCPRRIGVNPDGSGQYDRVPTTIAAHEAVRVHAPCPSWKK